MELFEQHLLSVNSYPRILHLKLCVKMTVDSKVHCSDECIDYFPVRYRLSNLARQDSTRGFILAVCLRSLYHLIFWTLNLNAHLNFFVVFFFS